jgi:hypothetical protein
MRLKKRRVRLHLKDNAPSVEGVLVANVDGHYLLKVPKVLNGTEDTISLGGDLEVPRSNVLFIQRLGGEA